MNSLKVFTLCLLLASPANAVMTGRFDLTSPPFAAAYQSLTDLRQATGFGKHLWTLSKDDQPLLTAGVCILRTTDGHNVGGGSLAVPGALLDWLLGTKWGDLWLPKLKTGMTIDYDPSRLRGFTPAFAGVGIKYQL